MSGKLVKYLSFSGFMTLGILIACCYFGWPIIEGIIILLPIPDPKILKQHFGSFLIKFKAVLASIPALFKQGTAQSGAPAGYRQDFELAPGSLAEDDDEEDFDIGKTTKKDILNYDSDEKNEGNELISLDKEKPKK